MDIKTELVSKVVEVDVEILTSERLQDHLVETEHLEIGRGLCDLLKTIFIFVKLGKGHVQTTSDFKGCVIGTQILEKVIILLEETWVDLRVETCPENELHVLFTPLLVRVFWVNCVSD